MGVPGPPLLRMRALAGTRVGWDELHSDYNLLTGPFAFPLFFGRPHNLRHRQNPFPAERSSNFYTAAALQHRTQLAEPKLETTQMSDTAAAPAPAVPKSSGLAPGGRGGKSSKNAKLAGRAGKGASRSVRAGLQMPVGRIARQLKKGRYAQRTGAGAAVYLAAVLEYLVAEILELAGNAAKDNKKQRIVPRHIMLAIRNDDELNKLLYEVTIAAAGVTPFIQKDLLPAKSAESGGKRKAGGDDQF